MQQELLLNVGSQRPRQQLSLGSKRKPGHALCPAAPSSSAHRSRCWGSRWRVRAAPSLTGDILESSAGPCLTLMMLICMGRLAGVSWHCDAVMVGYGHTPATAVDSLTLAGGSWHHGRPPAHVPEVQPCPPPAGRVLPRGKGLWGAQPFPKGSPGLAPLPPLALPSPWRSRVAHAASSGWGEWGVQ